MRSTSPRSLLGTAGTAVLLLLGALALLPAPAYAATCSSTDVTVVVRFPDRTEVGCAAGDPSSGYKALQGAGFSLTYAQGTGAGAICRIDGYPAGNPCTSMPPADAYWSYFHAAPGGSWTYSTRGGGSYNPKPGTVEGWCFACGDSWDGGNAPEVTTPAPPKPTKAPTAKPTRKPAKPTGKPSATATSSTTVAAPDASVSASGTPTPEATASATDSATSVPTELPSGSPSADASRPTSTRSDDTGSGGGLSWVWGLALLALLGAAGGGVAISRRKG